MHLQIMKALELHNARLKANGKKPLSKVHLSMHLYPLDEYKKGRKDFSMQKYYDNVRISFSNIINGQMIKISVDWIEVLCDVLGVDANFLFDQPSKFDKEYNKLCPVEE